MTAQERQVVFDLLRSIPAPDSMSIHELRAMFDQAGATAELPEEVVLEEVTIGAMRAEWSCTPHADPASALLYLHGGGYIFGSVVSHRGLVTGLGSLAGVRTLALDYRLAPEHKFPSPVEDAVAGYRYLLDQGLAPERIAVGGDSAGGGLAIALMITLREAGLPLPGAALCISPWVDMMLQGDSMVTKAELDPLVSRDVLTRTIGEYIAVEDRTDPRASPLLGDLAGLPPVMIQVSSHEVLLDDAHRITGRLAAADVAVRLQVWPRMPHVWHLYASMLSEGRAALEQAAGFLRECIR